MKKDCLPSSVCKWRNTEIRLRYQWLLFLLGQKQRNTSKFGVRCSIFGVFLLGQMQRPTSKFGVQCSLFHTPSQKQRPTSNFGVRYSVFSAGNRFSNPRVRFQPDLFYQFRKTIANSKGHKQTRSGSFIDCGRLNNPFILII